MPLDSVFSALSKDYHICPGNHNRLLSKEIILNVQQRFTNVEDRFELFVFKHTRWIRGFEKSLQRF